MLLSFIGYLKIESVNNVWIIFSPTKDNFWELFTPLKVFLGNNSQKKKLPLWNLKNIYLDQYCNDPQRIKSNDKLLLSISNQQRTLQFFGILRYFLPSSSFKRGPIPLKLSPTIPHNVTNIFLNSKNERIICRLSCVHSVILLY